MKKNYFIKVCIFLAIFLVMFCDKECEVYARKGSKILNGGVGNYGKNNRFYYVDSSCNNANGLVTVINNAWNDWINTSVYTPISVAKTTNKSASSFDFYYEAFSEYTGWYGRTYFYTNPSQAVELDDGPKSNYDWTQIKINSSNYNSLSTSSSNGYNLRKYVVAHEIGHAFGLRHEIISSSNNTISIMRHAPEYANTDKCSAYDLGHINEMYAN